MALLFERTYTSDKTFLILHLNKSKLRSTTTDSYLLSVLRIKTSLGYIIKRQFHNLIRVSRNI